MDKLQDLLDNGIITYGRVPWGSGTRNAVTIDGKNTNTIKIRKCLKY